MYDDPPVEHAERYAATPTRTQLNPGDSPGAFLTQVLRVFANQRGLLHGVPASRSTRGQAARTVQVMLPGISRAKSYTGKAAKKKLMQPSDARMALHWSLKPGDSGWSKLLLPGLPRLQVKEPTMAPKLTAVYTLHVERCLHGRRPTVATSLSFQVKRQVVKKSLVQESWRDLH
eukprot:1494891-Amphidinium_carterae.1